MKFEEIFKLSEIRRALSKSSKVINYDKEEITTLTEIQGQILSKGTISIVGYQMNTNRILDYFYFY